MKTQLPKNLKFEDALEELEDITGRLEEGKDSLEESMALYEKGMALKDFCEEKLKEAEGKWTILQKKKNGTIGSKEIPNDKIPESNELSDGQENMF